MNRSTAKRSFAKSSATSLGARTLGIGFVALLALASAAVVVQPRTARGDELEDKWIGKQAPPIKLNYTDGKVFDSRAKAMQGKVIVADIWATWCPPCRLSLPHIQEIGTDKALADKGLVVVGVNHGEKRGVIEPFLKENKYTFKVLFDTNKSLGQALGVTGIPTTLVIGRDGKVTNVFVGYGEGSSKLLDAAIEQALAAPAPAPVPAPTTKPATRPAARPAR